jgi:hypothetical protein
MISVVYATAADFEGRQTEDSLTEDSFKARVGDLAALIPVPAKHENKVIYVLLSAAACKVLGPVLTSIGGARDPWLNRHVIIGFEESQPTFGSIRLILGETGPICLAHSLPDFSGAGPKHALDIAVCPGTLRSPRATPLTARRIRDLTSAPIKAAKGPARRLKL